MPVVNSRRLTPDQKTDEKTTEDQDFGNPLPRFQAIPLRPELAMSTPDHLAKPSKDDLEKYIEENLPAHQIRWLTMQSHAFGYPRIRIFEAILSDWLSRHSTRKQWHTVEIEIARQAMDEFIFRH